MQTFHLVPSPKRVKILSDSLVACAESDLRISQDKHLPPQSYRLRINREGIDLASADEAGLFYGRQTLRQLHTQSPEGLPWMVIEDEPDFPVRGLYHDITRGKVPTLETLKSLAEKCAYYKMNQLQLYVEHSYAYKAFPEVWADTDPLQAEEILELDAFCAERFIDLVPSFSTFGHFYPFIHTPRFQHLNELERDVSNDGFNWFDRMGHYTLNCQDPESIALVDTLIAEVRPLFRSRYFNICADETFDLGKGKNRQQAEAKGTGRLYLDFVQQILESVRRQGATPMMWGDIVAKHPDLAPELGKDVVLLEWSYGEDPVCSPHLVKSERPFYVCSGTQSWNTFLPEIQVAYKNITRLNRLGAEGGCQGCLVTNWGDFGHIGMLSLAYPGMLIGAAASWNLQAAEAGETKLYEEISRVEYGDASGQLIGLLAEVGDPLQGLWQSVSFWLQSRSTFMPDEWFEAESGLPDIFLYKSCDQYSEQAQTIRDRQHELEKILESAHPLDSKALDEIGLSVDLSLLLLDVAVFLHRRRAGTEEPADPLILRIEEHVRRWNAQWLARNKPSEFYRIAEVMQKLLSDVRDPSF